MLDKSLPSWAYVIKEKDFTPPEGVKITAIVGNKSVDLDLSKNRAYFQREGTLTWTLDLTTGELTKFSSRYKAFLSIGMNGSGGLTITKLSELGWHITKTNFLVFNLKQDTRLLDKIKDLAYVMKTGETIAIPKELYNELRQGSRRSNTGT